MDLTRAVLRGDAPAAQRILTRKGIETAQLMAWLRHHHLAGQFFAAVADSRLAAAFPEAFLAEARRRYRRQAEHNARVLAATREVCAMLAACGIPAILLKGVHYAERFCGGTDRRFLWDIDLLVPSQELERALRCLLARGYTTKTGALWNNPATRRLSHAVALQRDGIELDLHRRLRHRPAYRIDYAALWGSRRAFQLGSDSFDVLSDEYSLLTLLLGIAHDLEAGKLRLKQLFDLHLMLGSLDGSLDWGAFFAARERERLGRLAVNVLSLYRVLFDVGDALPGMDAALHERRALVRDCDSNKAWRLVEAPRQSLYNRLWYASLYPQGALAYALWWSLTVPLRYALGRTL